MGAPDWDAALRPNARGGTAALPTRDISATDGQKVTLGGETITLYSDAGTHRRDRLDADIQS